MISIKSQTEIDAMHRAGLVLYKALETVKSLLKPDVSTFTLDEAAYDVIKSYGAYPSSKGYEGFPGSICTSVDDQVVHGIPSRKTILREGSIVGIDCTVLLDGYQADAAITLPVGQISPKAQRLIDVTEECFWRGAALAVNGAHIGDVAHAVQQCAEKNGYGVVRVLCGHGIGKEMHEDPEVPNFGRPGHGIRLRPGMTITIEPMITQGRYDVYVGDDDWTIFTKDGSLSSHYEHTLAIQKSGLPAILTLPDEVQRKFIL